MGEAVHAELLHFENFRISSLTGEEEGFVEEGEDGWKEAVQLAVQHFGCG